MGFFGALTYLGSDFAPYFVHSDGQQLENGNWVKVIAENGTLLSGRNDVNKVSEEFRPLKNSPLITDQEHQHISDWLENTIVPISTSAAKLKTTMDPVSGATLHVVNIKGTHGKLSEDLAAANINFRDKNDDFISDGDYLLINIDTEGKDYQAKYPWEHDGYDLDQVYIAGATVQDNFDDYRTGHVIYNLLDHVDTDEGNVTDAEPYTKTITNDSGSGVIIAPEATFKQNNVYGGQVFVKTYIRSGSEYHKSSLTDHHGHGNVHDSSVFVTNETDNHISVIKNLEGRNWKNEDSFTFTLEADNDRNAAGVMSPLPKDEKDRQITVTKENQGGFFGNIPYEQAGVYHYKIIEKSDNPIEGISYARPHYVTVTVTEASESADQSSNNDGESVNTDRNEETQDHDGESQEVSSKKFVTEVAWEDPDAVVTSDEKQVKVSLKVAKNQSSDDWQDATFILQPDDKKNTAGNDVPLPNTNDCTVTLTKNDQCQNFGEITFTQPGDYYYVIKEQSDKTDDDEEERNGGKSVTVSVSKQPDGKLTATVNRMDNVVIMTNRYKTTTLVLQKKWDDNGNETNRPEDITVHITLKDGNKRDVKLCKENLWSTTINDLSYAESYKDFTINEDPVKGYKFNGSSPDGDPVVTANGNKITITLTNTATQPEPSTPVNPTEPSSDTTKSSEESSTETPTSSSESGSTPVTETPTTAPKPSTTSPTETSTVPVTSQTTVPESSSTTPETSQVVTTPAETTVPDTSPVESTPAETTVPETSPVETTPAETTTSSHHDHHDHHDKPSPASSTPAETTTSTGNEHSDDVTTSEGEVLGAERDRALPTETSQDGEVLGANRDKAAGADRQVKTGDISMMRLYGVGAFAAIALLIGWFINWKKKQR
jgi:hypothetical protein